MKKLVIVLLLSLTGMANAQSPNFGIFKSVQATHDVDLETNPRAAFWHKAMPVYIVDDNMGNPTPRYRTEIRSRWTANNLYLLYVCPYQELHLKPNPSTTTETNQLWNWDVAEIFIGWDFQHIRRYKEFEMSPQGEWVDLDIDLDNPHDTNGWKWNSGFQVSTRIDRKRKIWYGAMRIPFSAIDPQAPQVGTTLRANMFRIQGPLSDRKLFAWQPTMSKTFHVPEFFGRLVLVDSHGKASSMP
ncbi:MAG TPA: carbohydrate-binding family 9-like protein [Acidobacteriaceae bacterium]|jgi:hypothetical protein|nr:carbohydrate-binding family 9-like protein [Acidobacteriaceae bacterium]